MKKEAIRNHFRRQALVNEAAPTRWIQGVPLGNGDVGVMQWGSAENLHFTLAKGDFWDLRQTNVEDERFNWAYFRKCIEAEDWTSLDEVWGKLSGIEGMTPTYLPVGRLTFQFDLRDLECSFSERLSLYRGRAERRLRHHQRHMEILSFVSKDPNVFCVRIQNQNLGRKIDIRFDRELRQGETDVAELLGYPEVKELAEDGSVAYLQKIPDSMASAVLLSAYRGDRRIDLSGDEESHTNLSVLSSAPLWVFVVIGTGKSRSQALEDAKSRMQIAEAQKAREISDAHEARWAEFWDQSMLSLGDKRLENLWHLELYKLASCSQKGFMPCNPQGLWPPDGELPPWRGNYHFNIKTQQTYWPVYTSNHLELAEPLYVWLLDVLPELRRETRQIFEVEGACVPTGTDPNGRRIDGWATVQLWTMAGAWLSHHFWQHYRYTLDRNFLRDRAFPFMKECLKFCEQMWEKDGELVSLSPSHSPELYGDLPQAWCRNSTLDISLMKFLLEACLEASEVLKSDVEQREAWHDMLTSLPPYPATNGHLCEWEGISTHESHRNLSHLAPIYPIGSLNIEGTEQESELARQSLTNLIQRGQGLWMSWTFPWASCIASRLGNSRVAMRMLSQYLEGFIEVNGYPTGGDYRKKGISAIEQLSPALEAGFGAAAAINEMILQSWGGKIRLFAGLPRDLDVSFESFRAESAFLVSSERVDGRAGPVEIKSLEGADCVLISPFQSRDILVHCSEESVPFKWKGDEIHFSTVAGQTYVVQEEQESGKLDFQPVNAGGDDKGNTFGIKAGKTRWWHSAAEMLRQKSPAFTKA